MNESVLEQMPAMEQTITFTNTSKKQELQKVLNFSLENAYYILFGYRQYNVDMEQYAVDHEELVEEYGIIKLQEKEVVDTTLISDMFIEFQICSLLVSKNQHINDIYGFDRLRSMGLGKRCSLFEGYEIIELEDEYLRIYKCL